MSDTNLPEGFTPTQDWVLVKLPPKEENTEKKTDFGLVLVNDDPEPIDGPLRAEVVSVGPGYFDQNGLRVPMDIQVGDIALYNAYSGTPMKENGEEYYFLNARSGSIIALIKKGGNE